MPAAGGPDLDLDRRCAAHVVSWSAIAVDERDELGGVGAAQHGDKLVPFDSIAREVEGMVIEHVRVSERESSRRRPIVIASRPSAGEHEHREHGGDGDEQRAGQWFTWWSERNTVHPSDAA